MRHLKLFEDFIETENYGEYNYGNGKSYIQYFKMKDTHSIVEFNGMDLESVYDIIGDHCIFCVYIDVVTGVLNFLTLKELISSSNISLVLPL